ncbi:MAG: cytidylate kinase family protein [Syntrophaceae bacterium]|nr:cytidylate kinase family protein [Syntrophaceae bacterium]
MAVITVSRQMGSLGTEIAQKVAEVLQYDFVDKEKMAEALATYGLPEPDLDKFDEKKPPVWDSLQVQRRKFLHFLQAVIYDYARKGNVIIVGRGGQVLLKDLPGAFHLRFVAPFEVRLRRFIERGGGDEKQATRILRRSDRDSAGFIRSFFDVDWDDPALYDLVINTRRLTQDMAVQMVLDFIRSPDLEEGGKKAEEKLRDIAILQKVEATLLGILGVEVRHINIQVEGGQVTLRGAVGSAAEKGNCEKSVARLEGVKKVDNQLFVTEYFRFGG